MRNYDIDFPYSVFLSNYLQTVSFLYTLVNRNGNKTLRNRITAEPRETLRILSDCIVGKNVNYLIFALNKALKLLNNSVERGRTLKRKLGFQITCSVATDVYIIPCRLYSSACVCHIMSTCFTPRTAFDSRHRKIRSLSPRTMRHSLHRMCQ